jgi:putative transposase
VEKLVVSAGNAAAERLAEIASDEAVDRMLADAQEAGVSLLDGPDGLLGQMTKKVIERALGAEMDDHLGYVKGDPAGNGSGNSRNGSFGKTVTTAAGPVRGCGAAGPQFHVPAGDRGERPAAAGPGR